MLIRGAELEDGTISDVRLIDGHIGAIGRFAPMPSEEVIEAAGGLLLPGLHDHHIHVASLAASMQSVQCGPPHVNDPDALATCLRAAGIGWLRGIGYHESVAGMLDAAALDRLIPDRPVRLQHRSGRMWFFNSVGLATVLDGRTPPPGLERQGGRFTGRLFDEDAWLRAALGGRPPCFAPVGDRLVQLGVTGLTEMSPANDAVMARHFVAEIVSGALPQRVLLAGSLALVPQDIVPVDIVTEDMVPADLAPRLKLGAAKLHLHEADLPALEDAVAFAQAAHAHGRVVACHCVTEVELVFALAMFDAAGAQSGDRIEHASLAPDWAVADIARAGLAVVTQPHFIAERGDAYLRDVPQEQHTLLYRARSWLDAGVTLAAGSDAPFGSADPWAAMRAAMSRRTAHGVELGGNEALTADEALDLYLRAPDALGKRRRVAVGSVADLCLLDRPWAAARRALSAEHVRAVFIDGRCLHNRVDQAPA